MLDRNITFIIVSHNSSKTLEHSIKSCIKAINADYRDDGCLIVYDNASTDKCVNIIDEYAQKYPDIFIGVKSTENIGFGRANNRAIEITRSKVYALINPDVVFEPSVIKQLFSTLTSSTKAAIVCPKLYYPDNLIQPSVRKFPTLSYFIIRSLFGESIQRKLSKFRYYYENLDEVDELLEVEWAIGAFMLISGEYVSKFGLFDEQYFLYFEDVTLCFNAWQNGFRVLLEPKATATHFYQRTSTRSCFNYPRLQHVMSALKFFMKYR